MSQSPGRREFLRTASGALGFWALAGCGGGSNTQNSTVATTGGLADTTGSKLSVSAATLAGIRARPESFLSYYGALGGSGSSSAYVQSKLPASFASLTDAGSMVVFASTVAFACAPAGATSLAPMTATLGQLLANANLTCGHYCKLATLLALLGHPELIPPDMPPGSPAQPTLHFLVWQENVPLKTGAHSQLVVTNALDNAYLLVDPMYGYAVRIPFVGAGPQADLIVVENAATLLQTPVGQDNLALLDPAGTAGLSQMLSVMTGGQLGPQYVYNDSIYGSYGWDKQISQVFNSMGAGTP